MKEHTTAKGGMKIPEEFLLWAFIDFARFLSGSPDAVKAFKDDVGLSGERADWPADTASKFLRWVALHWGEDQLPKDWEARIAAGPSAQQPGGNA